MKERKSGIEFLKIIAILLICISHSVQTVGDYIDYNVKFSISNSFLSFFRQFGMIGNTIFIICSSWFLLDSKILKSSKLYNILLDSVIISIGCLFGLTLAGNSFNFKEIIKNVLPDLFENMWFIPFYILFYISHPLLNSSIDRLTKEKHFIIVVIFVLFVVFFSLVFYIPNLSVIIGSYLIYIVVAFFKKYCNDFNNSIKKNLIVFIAGFTIFALIAVSKPFINQHFPQLGDRPFLNDGLSYFLTIPLICLFNAFNKMNFKSKFTNFISSCSLLIYCLHENILLRTYTRPKVIKYFLNLFGNQYVALWILGFGIILFILSALISSLYKLTISRLTKHIADKLSKLTNRFISFVYLKFFKDKNTEYSSVQ